MACCQLAFPTSLSTFAMFMCFTWKTKLNLMLLQQMTLTSNTILSPFSALEKIFLNVYLNPMHQQTIICSCSRKYKKFKAEFMHKITDYCQRKINERMSTIWSIEILEVSKKAYIDIVLQLSVGFRSRVSLDSTMACTSFLYIITLGFISSP